MSRYYFIEKPFHWDKGSVEKIDRIADSIIDADTVSVD